MRVIDYFHQGLERGPDRVAFLDDRRSLTFREVDELTAKVAAGLQALGAADGVKIAVCSPNDAMAFVCLLGAIRAGAVWLPINVRNPTEVNAAFLRRTGCEVLFFHSSLRDQMRDLSTQVPTLRTAICMDGPDPVATMSFDDLVAVSDKLAREVPDDRDRVVAIFPTGGTTGLSKAALLPQRVWETVISTFWTCCPTTSPPVCLVATPMTHGGGGVALFMQPAGTTTVLLRQADPVAIMKAIQEHRVTHMFMPPTLVYMILAHPDVGTYDLSSLEYLIVAGAPIAPEKLQEALDVFNGAVCQSFGQAEAPFMLTFLSSHDLRTADRTRKPDRFASCGRPTIGSQVAIMDDGGRLLPPGETGEIVARGELVFGGYYDNPEATEEVSRFGWHHTGDVGFKDDEGYVYIVDRKKDMIITGGFNVFSAEVEHVILAHDAVQDCAVIGAPDEKWGEAVTAVIETKPGRAVAEDEIYRLVRERLGGVHAPKVVQVWPELPRSSNGKVLKSEVRKAFWADRERAV